MPHPKPRLYRDPVHDTIVLAPETAEGRVLIELVDSPEMQRLRRIRQLALSHLVYHGAEHSRFAHSMGVCWVARAMLDRLERTVEISEEERLVTACAALLHDVGHGPFSHALEKLSGVRHEERTVQILCHPDSGVYRVLSSVSPDFPERVAARIRGDGPGPAYLKEIVSSQLDADRLDYILRDGHMTGVRIGNYDLARVLAMLDVVDGHLAVHQGGQAAVEGYLLARFHMYQQVYLHKTSRAAERMLSAALSRAVQVRRGGDHEMWWPDDSLGAVLLGEGEDPLAFATIDDVDVWRCLKRWAEAPDRALSDLSRGLLGRRLYKTRALPMGPEGDTLLARAREQAESLGFQPDYHVLLDASGDSPYHPYTGVGHDARSIRMVLRSGEPCYIEERSAVVGMLGQLEHHQRLVCFHPDLTEAMTGVIPSST